MPANAWINPKTGSVIDTVTGHELSPTERASFFAANPHFSGAGATQAARAPRTSTEGQINSAGMIAPQVIHKLYELSDDSAHLGFKTGEEAQLFGYGVPNVGAGGTPHGLFGGIAGGLGALGKTGIGLAENALGRDQSKVNSFINLNDATVSLSELMKQFRATDVEFKGIDTRQAPNGLNPDIVNQQKIHDLLDNQFLALARRDAIARGEDYTKITIDQARKLYGRGGPLDPTAGETVSPKPYEGNAKAPGAGDYTTVREVPYQAPGAPAPVAAAAAAPASAPAAPAMVTPSSSALQQLLAPAVAARAAAAAGPAPVARAPVPARLPPPSAAPIGGPVLLRNLASLGGQ